MALREQGEQNGKVPFAKRRLTRSLVEKSLRVQFHRDFWRISPRITERRAAKADTLAFTTVSSNVFLYQECLAEKWMPLKSLGLARGETIL